MDVKPMWSDARDALTRRRWQATLLALFASLVTAVLVGVSWYRAIDAARDARVAQFGNAAAAQLAALAIEPLITLDKIRLGVLATRMSELPDLQSASIVTLDDRIVASAGPRPSAGTPLYTQPIEFEGAIAGYVQVAVAPDAFSAAGITTPYLLLPALIAALLSAAAGYLLGLRSDAIPSRDEEVDALDTPAATVTEWLLVVNLPNLMTLAGAERTAVLADARRRATLVARQSVADTVDLANTGMLLRFDDADPDQCFKVLCAALMLADSLDDLNRARHVAARPELKFRFGAHIARRAPDSPTDPKSDAVADAVVLSAVAPEGSIAVSREAFERLSRPERFVVERLENPVLRTLATASHDGCVVVSAVADAYGAALDHQSELLRAQDVSTDTPSTL